MGGVSQPAQACSALAKDPERQYIGKSTPAVTAIQGVVSVCVCGGVLFWQCSGRGAVQGGE